jgi:hypothetical protein
VLTRSEEGRAREGGRSAAAVLRGPPPNPD